jgi:hypothetical protein
MAWLNALFVLAVNAVPLYGALVLGWSAITIVVLYWFESVLVIAATIIRILAHRKLTRKSGHWRGGSLGGMQVNGRTVKSSLLSEYATIAIVFTAAHGVFVAVIAFMATANRPEAQWHFSFSEFRYGAISIALFTLGDLIADLATLKQRSFAWISGYVQRRLGRVFVMHLTIIFGMFAMMAMDTPYALLYVFIGLKLLMDLGGTSGKVEIDPVPAKAPPWALKLADRIGKEKGGAKAMAADFERDAENARQRAIEDERPLDSVPA